MEMIPSGIAGFAHVGENIAALNLLADVGAISFQNVRIEGKEAVLMIDHEIITVPARARRNHDHAVFNRSNRHAMPRKGGWNQIHAVMAALLALFRRLHAAQHQGIIYRGHEIRHNGGIFRWSLRRLREGIQIFFFVFGGAPRMRAFAAIPLDKGIFKQNRLWHDARRQAD